MDPKGDIQTARPAVDWESTHVKGFNYLFKSLAILAAAGSLSLAAPAFAQSSMGSSMTASAQDPMVGGAAMYPSKNIVQNALNSKDHTTLVSLVKKAGLVETLEGKGPFTVLAPTNEAFDALPKATVSNVTSNDALLKKVLTYHVLPGRVTVADIEAKIQAGGGTAQLKTVEGDTITAKMDGSNVELMGAGGGKAEITVSNVYQSNGVIQVIDGVLIP